MNNKSIRFRLTIWYTLAFSIAVLVIFTSFYFITRESFFSQTDSTLAAHTLSIVNVIKQQENPMHQMMFRDVFFSEYSESPGMLVVILDDFGNIIGSSLTVNQTDPVFNQLFEESRRLKHAFYKDQNLSDIPMRFYIKPVYEGDTLTAVVAMAHPMDIIQKSLSHLLVTLISVFFIFLVPTILGGYILAKSGMYPIAMISEKLKEITSENLDKRVENPHTHDELEELTVTFNSMLDRLHKAFSRERQFIGDVAHEMKTPLATQRSQIEVILSKERAKDDYKKALTEMLIDNEKMGTTINNILDLAWSEAEISKKQKHGESFHLTDLISELKDVADSMAVMKKIHIEATITPHVFVYGKKEKVGRAILNILDNAIKYTPQKGKVVLSLTRTQKNAVITVQDTGTGIARADLPHIFKRFYRGSKTDNAIGAGLGLAIAQSIIHTHRGEIEVKSTPKIGTKVIITLPLAVKS